MHQQGVQIESVNRTRLVSRGRKLEYFTIAYNSLEGVIAIVAGLFAGSTALVGFGIDSVIEVTSGAALLWRLHMDVNEEKRERIEVITLRIVGGCFIALALYLIYDSATTLISRTPPERSIPGIVLAAVSVLVMPLLTREKRKVIIYLTHLPNHQLRHALTICTGGLR
jgi:divalent metal cation (Fe/Co/Zn/Cd) transporter